MRFMVCDREKEMARKAAYKMMPKLNEFGNTRNKSIRNGVQYNT